MKCPVCKDPMVILELNQIEVDYCVSCSGIWLDNGELALLLEGSEDKEELTSSFKVDQSSKEKPNKCPICYKKMEKMKGGINAEISIDQCKNNHGLWFDKGELNLFIESGKQGKDSKLLVMLNDMFKYILNNK